MSDYSNQGGRRASPWQALEFAETSNPYGERESNLTQVSPLAMYETPVTTNTYDIPNHFFGTSFGPKKTPNRMPLDPGMSVSADLQQTPLQQVLKFYGGIAQDAFAGGMQAAPTWVQGWADNAHMVTDDKYSKRLSDDMGSGQDLIRELFGTPMLNEQRKEFDQIWDDPDKSFGDAASYWVSHPRVALESILANITLARLPANLAKYGGKYGGKYLRKYGEILEKMYGIGSQAAATGR